VCYRIWLQSGVGVESTTLDPVDADVVDVAWPRNCGYGKENDSVSAGIGLPIAIMSTSRGVKKSLPSGTYIPPHQTAKLSRSLRIQLLEHWILTAET